MDKLPVFIVSLPEATDRRARIAKIMDDLGLEFEFVDAVDGRKFDVVNHPLYNAPRRLRAFGKHLTGGDLGCILSHKKIYQRMVDENISAALIFEDDVLLRDAFLPVLEKIKTIDVPFDMIRFFGSPKLERLKMRNVCKLDDTHHLVRHSGMPGGSHATLMRLSGAKKMLKHMERTSLPIDALLGRSWLTGINWYTVRPGLAAQDLSFDSSIGDERFDKKKDIKGLAKTLYPLTRAWFKFIETLCKKFWYYKTYFIDKTYKDRKYG